MSIEKITDDIFAVVEWDGGNIACINTDQGVVLVDTPMLPEHIEEWKRFVLGLNPKGIKYIINTHIHFDHIIGNHQLGGITIMHQKMREDLFKKNATLREGFIVPGMPGRTREQIDFILSQPIVASEITMSEELTLHMGNHTLRLYHMGGHSPDSIIVYVEEDKVLIAGDNIVSGMHPYKGNACFNDWIKALERMKTLDIETVVPGHGPICTKDTIDKLLTYFQKLWDMTWDMTSKELPEDKIVQSVQEEMFTYFAVDPEMIERSRMMFDMGTRQLMKEISLG
jgi:cyclase